VISPLLVVLLNSPVVGEGFEPLHCLCEQLRMSGLQPSAKRNFLLLFFNQFPRFNSNLAWREIFDYNSVRFRGVDGGNYDFYQWLKVSMFVRQLYRNVRTLFSRLIHSTSYSKLPFQHTPRVTWKSVSVLSLHVSPVWSHDPPYRCTVSGSTALHVTDNQGSAVWILKTC